MNEYEQTVLIIPTPGGATVIASRPASDGWLPIGSRVLADMLPKILGSAKGQEYSSRFFAMSEADLALWDQTRKFTKNGYSLAQARTDAGQIEANLRVREVRPPATGMPTPDLLAFSNAAALASIQASIEDLTELVKQVLDKVTRVADFLETSQQAKLLAAEDIIVRVHDRFLEIGSVTDQDAARLYGVEHCLRTTHREVIAELTRTSKRSAYRNPGGAEKFREESTGRVDVLLQLEVHVLRTLAKWLQLDLAIRDRDGHGQVSDAATAMNDLESQADAVLSALRELARVDTHMEGRNWWDALCYKGLIGTELAESKLRDSADRLRDEIQSLAVAGAESIERVTYEGRGGLRADGVGASPRLQLVS